jgi:hypothetical protein
MLQCIQSQPYSFEEGNLFLHLFSHHQQHDLLHAQLKVHQVIFSFHNSPSKMILYQLPCHSFKYQDTTGLLLLVEGRLLAVNELELNGT